MSIIRKLTSTPVIYFATGLFILIMILTSSETFSAKLASVYGFMILFDFILAQLITTKININAVGGNTMQSLMYAFGAIVTLVVVYNILNYVARTSVALPPSESGVFVNNLAQIKSQAVLMSIDFERIPFFSFILFGIVIPILETRLLARMFDFITQVFNITYNRMSISLVAVITFLAGIFTYFHFKVRGLDNNLDLLLTASFAVITVWMFIKFKEAESATEFHIGWNSYSLIAG